MAEQPAHDNLRPGSSVTGFSVAHHELFRCCGLRIYCTACLAQGRGERIHRETMRYRGSATSPKSSANTTKLFVLIMASLEIQNSENVAVLELATHKCVERLRQQVARILPFRSRPTSRTMWDRLTTWPILPPKLRHLPCLLPAHDWTACYRALVRASSDAQRRVLCRRLGICQSCDAPALHDFGGSPVTP